MRLTTSASSSDTISQDILGVRDDVDKAVTAHGATADNAWTRADDDFTDGVN